MGDITIISKSVTIRAAMMGDPDLTVTLFPDGDDSPWHPGKPVYRYEVTDGEHTFSGIALAGYGDTRGVARSLCSFLVNDLERSDNGQRERDRDGDPVPDYSPKDWAFLVRHSETLSMGSVEPNAEDD
jgi:hypothetical protein